MYPYKSDFRVTSPQMENRTVMGVTANHNGIDLVGVDKNIYAVSDGAVVKSEIITNRANINWGVWKPRLDSKTVYNRNAKVAVGSERNRRRGREGRVTGRIILWTGCGV